MNKCKRILVFLSCLAMLVRPGTGRAAVTEQMDASYENENYVMGTVSVSRDEVFANVSRIAGNGSVQGSGVRLRKKPSSSAAVLELMYQGEYVFITYANSTTNWYYLERIKTGTWGYAAKECISTIVC